MYIYLDESGDPGFQIDRSATRFFVIATVIVQDPIVLSDAVDRLRQAIGYTRDPEFKGVSTPPAIRRRFLEAICAWDFEVRALIVDKHIVVEPKRQSKESLYDHFVACLFEPGNPRFSNATLVMDEQMKSRDAQNVATRKIRELLNVSDASTRPIRAVKYRNSRGDNVLQATDMIANTIYQYCKTGDDQLFRLIRDRTQLWNY